MSRLITTPRAAHVHRDWDSQPLIQSARPRRQSRALLVVAAFVAGLMLGLLV